MFTLSANISVANYRLAVKKASNPAPTAAEMEIGHHIKRNLSAAPINIIITHYLNAPILIWAKTEDALNNSKLPANIAIGDSFLNDASLATTDQWVNQSLLAQSTVHKIYGMQEGGSVVQELLTFNTDISISAIRTMGTDYVMDASLSNLDPNKSH